MRASRVTALLYRVLSNVRAGNDRRVNELTVGRRLFRSGIKFVNNNDCINSLIIRYYAFALRANRVN